MIMSSKSKKFIFVFPLTMMFARTGLANAEDSGHSHVLPHGCGWDPTRTGIEDREVWEDRAMSG